MLFPFPLALFPFPFPFPSWAVWLFPFPWDSHGNGIPMGFPTPMHTCTSDLRYMLALPRSPRPLLLFQLLDPPVHQLPFPCILPSHKQNLVFLLYSVHGIHCPGNNRLHVAAHFLETNHGPQGARGPRYSSVPVSLERSACILSRRQLAVIMSHWWQLSLPTGAMLSWWVTDLSPHQALIPPCVFSVNVI